MIGRLRQVARNARAEGETKARQVYDALLFVGALAVILLDLAVLAVLGGGK